MKQVQRSSCVLLFFIIASIYGVKYIRCHPIYFLKCVLLFNIIIVRNMGVKFLFVSKSIKFSLNFRLDQISFSKFNRLKFYVNKIVFLWQIGACIDFFAFSQNSLRSNLDHHVLIFSHQNNLFPGGEIDSFKMANAAVVAYASLRD